MLLRGDARRAIRKMRDKVVYFVRHGEAAHNVDPAAFSTADNPLTARGRQQASTTLRSCLRAIVGDADRGGPFDAVVTSPMTRAIETCLYSTDGLLSAGVTPRVEPLCTERGSSVCDRGSGRSILQARFPMLNFDALAPADVWWDEDEERYGPDSDECDYLQHARIVSARALALAEWLESLPARRVAVFGHAGIFRALLCRNFRNCEVAMYHWPPKGFPPGGPVRSWDGAVSSKL